MLQRGGLTLLRKESSSQSGLMLCPQAYCVLGANGSQLPLPNRDREVTTWWPSNDIKTGRETLRPFVEEKDSCLLSHLDHCGVRHFSLFKPYPL